MKSENGITLTSLVIYIIVATILIGTMATLSSFFFSNMTLIEDQDKYAPEFNKFNMFFIEDIKRNKSATVEKQKITFEDGIIYQFNIQEQAIYRNDTKIAEEVQSIEFNDKKTQVKHTTKQIITVNMSIGKDKNFKKTIEYVLRYWE